MMEVIDGEDLIKLIRSFGYLGLFAIVFAESGLLVGFFLPGDSLLFTAGILASQGILNIYWLIVVLLSAAIIGDNAGYMFGSKVGPKLFQKEESFFFHKKNLVRSEQFYERYGAMTIVLARFIPVVRTFAPIVAGIGKMRYRTFLLFNILGGTVWVLSICLAGFFLPRFFPDIEKHLEIAIMVIIVLSVIPPAIHLMREKLTSRKKPERND